MHRMPLPHGLAGWALVLTTFVLTAAVQLVGPRPEKPDNSPGAEFAPLIEPRAEIPRVQVAPAVDGDLSDAVWKDARRMTGFSETFPDEMAEPPIGITAWMAYDSENLYVAYEIEDDPARIRARYSERDAMWQDDYAGFMLDTNGDGQTVYFVSANPYGIQGDTRTSPQGEDGSFDLIYTSAGTITDRGYVVEMAIPFRSLRFPERDVQSWRLTHWITHPRETRNTYSWAALDRDNPCMPCQLGHITGIEGVSPGRNLEILPSFTGSQSSEWNALSGRLDNDGASSIPSLNLKYGVTSEITVDATINPDFSQIESDAAQIDVNTPFALFFPERREFFQEGSDLYNTNFDVVYTRSINDPIAASKLSGRSGNWTLGYIAARDENSPLLIPLEESSRLVSAGESWATVARARRSFENNSFVAGLVSDRRYDMGGSGTTFGVDGALRFSTKYQFEWQALGHRTREADGADAAAAGSAAGLEGTFDDGAHTLALDGESYWGNALYSSLERNARHWSFDVDYWHSSPTFRTENGFVTQNDNRRVTFFQDYSFWTEDNRYVDRFTPWMAIGRVWNWDGERKDNWIVGGVRAQLIRQTFVGADINTSSERFAGVQFDNMLKGSANVNTVLTKQVQLGAFVSLGEAIFRTSSPELGRQLSGRLNATLRPNDRLVFSPSLNYSRLRSKETGDDFFAGYILRTRTNYQFTRKLLARVIVQYNDFSESIQIDPLVTFRVSPFTVFHIGSSHELQDRVTGVNPASPSAESDALQRTVFGQTRRQVFFKLQYLLRV
ncbi:MAG: hypothetical protein COV99_09250 [Bacteroidetes bacterium CG12_big_fil_rev_8_21_14_0_65_60_17]|nr:MAG: hypothetical protein COV99_09250 [Bacteroidetes bacterium CG12_big_fil_rev_8_21_14_0_65_60_17]